MTPYRFLARRQTRADREVAELRLLLPRLRQSNSYVQGDGNPKYDRNLFKLWSVHNDYKLQNGSSLQCTTLTLGPERIKSEMTIIYDF